MSTLETYRSKKTPIVVFDPLEPFEPGVLVCHEVDKNVVGTVVAVCSDHIYVLWSHEPEGLWLDIEEFREKMFASMGIPMKYLGFIEDEVTQLKTYAPNGAS